MKINLIDFIRDRREVDAFDESVLMSEYDVRQILESVKYAPFEGSRSTVSYRVMLSKDEREVLSHASYDTYSILTASAVVLVVVNSTEFREGRVVSYGSAGKRYREGAVRDGSMSGMLFMLVSKYFGWDSTSVVRFKEGIVRRVFGLSYDEMPVMLIALGKESSTYLEGDSAEDVVSREDYITFL